MGTDEQDALIDIPPTVSAGANVVGMHNYLAVWEKSVNDPQAYWMEQALSATAQATSTLPARPLTLRRRTAHGCVSRVHRV